MSMVVLAADEFWGLVTKRGKVMLESENEPYPALSKRKSLLYSGADDGRRLAIVSVKIKRILEEK